MNRRSHELLHAVYVTPPSVLSTDAVNFKLYMVHAHYNELDAIYAFNSQPSQCLYYVIIRIIEAGVSLALALALALAVPSQALAWLGIKSIYRIKLIVVSVHHI